MNQGYDVAVVGEGISGLTAANELAKLGFRVATFEASMFGGLILNVNELWPALDRPDQSGVELCANLYEANAQLGAQSVQQAVRALTPGDGYFEVATDDGTHRARQVIVASGAGLRMLGITGEREFEGRGVSHCADCDGALFRSEDVVVVGGGDSALQEALVLAAYCRRVHLVHDRVLPTARNEFVQRVAASAVIARVPNATVEAIEGDQSVTGVRVRVGGATESLRIDCAGVFPFIGLVPHCEFVPEVVDRDERGFLVADDTGQSSVRGLWVAGAVRSGCGGTVADAVADAHRSAASAAARLV